MMEYSASNSASSTASTPWNTRSLDPKLRLIWWIYIYMDMQMYMQMYMQVYIMYMYMYVNVNMYMNMNELTRYNVHKI